ncbi:MAG: tRNA (adenosine(37)-N6)-dimethylallyltransferase MiaA [Bacteroidota bacterium]|nr:tRNA (adenosine(37)-N6)-dimethylallyltransferase MiaA [Bacteroidota bacterium]
MVITGPTAVGKTALSIALAKTLNTEIISADSRQCYKELNIGVAKPSAEELQDVHHYFINSHSIHEEVNAGTFEQYALQAANTIFQKNKVVVMVGGTGLYIKAFCEGIDVMPAIAKETRKHIVDAFESNGIEWLQNELKEKDPVFWQIAEQQNPHRLMRALEVLYETGKSITSFRRHQSVERPFNIIKIGLQLPKEQLHQRINHRVDIMMEMGLLKEVEGLYKFKYLNALQTVGYKELFDFLSSKCSLEQAVEQIKINTRQYAKRQVTWFKRDTSIDWLDANTITADEILHRFL